jgi:sulfoxide reductase heme-binding subunit YedZ
VVLLNKFNSLMAGKLNVRLFHGRKTGGAGIRHSRLKGYLLIGLALLTVFLALQVGHWRWPWLASLQADDSYKQISGFLLLGYIAAQWRLSIRRAKAGSPVARNVQEQHKLFGAFAPLFFFAHSQHIGFAYLEALSLVYFAIFLTGLCNQEITRFRRPFLAFGWIILHAGLSTALLFLLGYHIYTSYLFE